MSCAEHLRQGLADEKVSLEQIRVLRAHIKSLIQEKRDLERKKLGLKAKQFAVQIEAELKLKQHELTQLEKEFPNAFKEI